MSYLQGEICHALFFHQRSKCVFVVSAWAKWQVGQHILVTGREIEHTGLYATVTSCEYLKAFNACAPRSFPLYLQHSDPFYLKNILPHGPNSLLLNLSKHYPVRFILSPENYLSFWYETGISSSYKQVLSMTGFACPSTLHVFMTWV